MLMSTAEYSGTLRSNTKERMRGCRLYSILFLKTVSLSRPSFCIDSARLNWLVHLGSVYPVLSVGYGLELLFTRRVFWECYYCWNFVRAILKDAWFPWRGELMSAELSVFPIERWIYNQLFQESVCMNGGFTLQSFSPYKVWMEIASRLPSYLFSLFSWVFKLNFSMRNAEHLTILK